MEIAILAWGSLITNPEPLQYQGNWEPCSFTLPVEFSRISNKGRLTLVIDPTNGVETPIQFVTSSFINLNKAIRNLSEREGKPKAEDIGYINLVAGTSRCHYQDIANRIQIWAQASGFDAVIWTDLQSNFEEKQGEPFSVEHAVSYLRGLSGEDKREAQNYIRNAPEFVVTPVRTEIARTGWLEEQS